MKKILLLMALYLVSLAICAQSQLVVTATDGSQTKIALNQKPTVTLGKYGDKVIISYGEKRKEVDLKDLKFEGVGPNEMLVIDDQMLVPLAGLKSIVSASYEDEADHLANVISKNPAYSLYYSALQATHIKDSLTHYIDLTYTWKEDRFRIDSCTWTNDKLCIPVAKDINGGGGEYDNVAYPECRYFNYTALLVPDSTLKNKYNIVTLDDLRKKAHELYDPMYPEDKNVTDETDRRNALNRFISYHILPIYGEYYSLTAMDNGDLQYNFNRQKSDIADWYETLMPYSIIKFSFPSGSQTGLYVNNRGVRNDADARGVYVRGSKVTSPTEYQEEHTAINGIYHCVDDIVAYDETMQKTVCNDRMRIEATTLSPDFMTKLTDGQVARGHTWAGGKKYGVASNSSDTATNPNRSVGFKPGYVRNFEYNDDTHMHIRGRSLWFWSYQGDEMILKGDFDTKIKLPSLPAGKYELRFFTCVGFGTRGVLNLYIDDNLVGESIDFRPGGRSLFEWKSDDDLRRNGGGDEAIVAFDKEIHAKGWMKGPGNYSPGWRSSFDAGSSSMRDLDNTIRRVVGTFETDGKSDHYFRLVQMLDGSLYELNFDFIELIPVSMIDEEDIY